MEMQSINALNEKENTFLDSAFKHHSSAQAAIKYCQVFESAKDKFEAGVHFIKQCTHNDNKSLQEQLEYLDELRKSAKESSILKEEKELEKSTHDLLSSAHRFLLDSPGNTRNNFSPLSSTVNNFESVRDEITVRNLLPSFENIRNKQDHENLTHSVSPIKPSIYFGNLTKDSLASTTLHLSPTTNSHLSTTIMSGATSLKNSLNSPIKQTKVVSSNGSLNLTDILSRLAYGSVCSAGTDNSENMSTSGDELLGVLDKITRTGQQLQAELQNAKQRELRLAREIQYLRSKTNGFSPHHYSGDAHMSVGYADVEGKCKKLEDAMLSLQDQNLNLNRLLRERSSPDPQVDELKETKRSLAAVESEKRLLQATVDRMKAQLAYLEERHHRCTSSAETSPASVVNPSIVDVKPDAMQNEKQLMLEEKIKRLEHALSATRSGASNSKHLQERIDEIHATLLKKNDYINQCESDLQDARIENKELNDKYEAVQHKDVYKRKEVLLLCEKFENLKEKHLILETEVMGLRKKDNKDEGNAEDSLRKFLMENEALHCRLIAEQREMSLSKSMLEKDYNSIKHRYDKLLTRLSRLDASSRKDALKNNEDGGKDTSADPQPFPTLPCGCQLLSHQAPRRSISEEDPPKSSERRLQPVQSNLHHFTTPASSSLPHRSAQTPNLNSFEIDLHRSHSSKKATSPTTKPPTYINSISPSQSLSSFASRSKYITSAVPQFSCGNADDIDGSEAEEKIALARDDAQNCFDPRVSKEDSQFNMAPSGHAYEEEYARSMGVTLRSRSCDQLDDRYLKQKDENNALRSRSEILGSGSPQRKRFHTTPCSVTNFQSSPASTETPYTREYLSNMDGVRLLVSLGNGGSAHKRSGSIELLSPDKNLPHDLTFTRESFLKSETPYDSALAKDLSRRPLASSSNICDVTATTAPTISTTDTKYSHPDSDSSTSEDSLHLSDLPSDHATVVDKFRNYDDYKRPPPVVQIGDNQRIKLQPPFKKSRTQNQNLIKVTSSGDKYAKKPEVRRRTKVAANATNLKGLSTKDLKSFVMSRREENDLVDQSSASTTRDHMGRIEFLRDIQINTGMRLHGLVADASIQDKVALNESDLNGEVRLGLSNNQEAYAEKLVTKYTKNARKILASA